MTPFARPRPEPTARLALVLVTLAVGLASVGTGLFGGEPCRLLGHRAAKASTPGLDE